MSNGNGNGNGLDTPICRFLERLTAGDDVDFVVVGGEQIAVDAFTSYEQNTGITTFVQADGAVFIVGCDQIDGLIIDN